MLPAQWVCRRCLTALARPLTRNFNRLASTDATASLPPILLERARNIAKEHEQLTHALESNFDTKAAKRAGELSRVATALKEWDAAQSSITELTALLDSKDAKDEELQELAREELSAAYSSLEPLATALSVSLTPRDPFADMPCLLEIRPGPGGLEGRYFADSLVRMYRQYCSRKGLQVQIVKYELVDGGEATAGGANESPLQEAVLKVLNEGAYDMFRGEAGMHRVQRVPATEKNGRTHTSAVAVWVLPSFPEDSVSEEDALNPESIFYVDPAEVETERMRASGAGGQHVNKTESAIRLTHRPTGITVSMQDQRSQHANRRAAWALLQSRIAQRRREEREEQAMALRNNVLSKDKITRGDKIRTYNYSQDRCSDHRSGLDVHNLPDVLEGGETLEKVMESAKQWLVQRDIRAMMAEEEAKAAAATSKNTKKAK
ncbi:release factor [Xylariaceae sp. FL0594]|nr:release factor [Xylariaceae sp. FL0594]